MPPLKPKYNAGAKTASDHATGVPWYGFDVERTGPVVHITTEGVGAMRKQLRGLELHYDSKANEGLRYIKEAFAKAKKGREYQWMESDTMTAKDWRETATVNRQQKEKNSVIEDVCITVANMLDAYRLADGKEVTLRDLQAIVKTV